MLRRLVDLSLENRAIVLLAAVLLIAGGAYSLTQLPIDAQPDITNVQVQVLTKAPALGPVEMEQFVTYPVEAAISSSPSASSRHAKRSRRVWALPSWVRSRPGSATSSSSQSRETASPRWSAGRSSTG